MIKITAKERKKAGHIYCPYCKPEKVDAVYRVTGWGDRSRDVACEKHKDNIFQDSGHYTEADYQTWMQV